MKNFQHYKLLTWKFSANSYARANVTIRACIKQVPGRLRNDVAFLKGLPGSS